MRRYVVQIRKLTESWDEEGTVRKLETEIVIIVGGANEGELIYLNIVQKRIYTTNQVLSDLLCLGYCPNSHSL